MTPEEQQEAVRRALAATLPEGPMPPEVVARLEATIADLAAARPAAPTASREAGAEPGGGAVVTDLEARRRRRWPRALVAAASIAVLAYGVGAVLPDLGSEAETAMDSAGGEAAEDHEPEAAVGGSAGRDGAEGAGPGAEPAPQSAPELMGDGRVVALREATLRRDVVRHLSAERVAALADGPADRDAAAERYTRRDGTCVIPESRRGDALYAARLDGRRATLVVRDAEGGSRVAQVYWCGDGRTLLAETEVPARR